MFPTTANAGLFGVITSIFAQEKPIEEVASKEQNSQTMPLLQPTLNPAYDPARGGAEIQVDDYALLPETNTGGVDVVRPKNDQISVYVVKEGDTISQIAELFGVSVNTIRWGNDLSWTDVITPGQRLVILPVSGVRHTVAKGETLQSIVKKYEGDVDEVIQFNNLSSDAVLAVGQTIIIPGGELHQEAPAKATSPGGSSRSVAGYFSHPLPGAVLTQGIHGYNGIDLGAPAGTAVYAAASGEVIVSKQGGWNGGYGNYVVIRHANGTQTLYAHHTSNAVAVGQQVKQGQVIGYVGSTGRSTGNHLHFEVRGARNPFAR